jgi:hypothetical protein
MPSRINRILIAVTALFATALVVSLINFRDRGLTRIGTEIGHRDTHC